MLWLLFLLLINSCGNSGSCTYQLEEGLKMTISYDTYDVSLNDYVVEKTVELTNKKGELLIFWLPDSERHDFAVVERKILWEQDSIHSLWFYTIDRPKVVVVNVEQMKVLDGYENKYCSCNEKTCKETCEPILYCNK